jgi:hypothetical protein
MSYQENRTKILGYHGNWLVAEGPTMNGTSGGPILTDARIVGVIAEVIGDNRSKVTRGVNCQQIRVWIKQQGAKCDWILGEGTPPPPQIEIAVPPSAPQQPCPPGCICPGKGDCDEVRKEVAELKGSLTALIGRIDKIAAQPGPQGPQGPRGPQGPAGKVAVVDYDRLAAEVAKRLPPMTFQMIGEDGKVKQSFKAGLGETVPFQLVPVTRAQ